MFKRIFRDKALEFPILIFQTISGWLIGLPLQFSLSKNVSSLSSPYDLYTSGAQKFIITWMLFGRNVPLGMGC